MSEMKANLRFNCCKLKQQSNTIYWKTDVLESLNKAACFLIGSSLGCLYKICKVDLVQLLVSICVCVCVRERERERSLITVIIQYVSFIRLCSYDLNVCISVVKCWGLHSPGILCSIDWWFGTYVSGQLTGNKIPVYAA